MFSDYFPALSCLADLTGPAKFHGSSIFKLSPDTLLDPLFQQSYVILHHHSTGPLHLCLPLKEEILI